MEKEDLTDLGDVKNNFLAILKGDATLVGMLGKDRKGEIPVYLGWQQSQKVRLPSVSIIDVADVGEVAGLGDLLAGGKRYEWYHAIIQVDAWASDTDKRDEISAQMKKVVLGKTTEFEQARLSVSPPSLIPVDEVEENSPIFRHSLRFPVWYVMEALQS